MASAPKPMTVRAIPNFRSARITGILNVVFATLLLVFGLCMSSYVATLPLLGRAFTAYQAQIDKIGDQQRQTALRGLDEQLQKADTEAAKAEILERKKKLENSPKLGAGVNMMDFSKMGFDDPVVIGWSWVEIVTGLALNVMLIASGVGLMHWKPWARKLGLWTAGLKILRLVVLYTGFVILIVPPVAKNLGDMVGEMMNQQQAGLGRAGGAPPKELFVRIYSVMYSVMGVGYMAVGSVYPAVLLWVLTRPGIASACSGRFVLPKEPNQP